MDSALKKKVNLLIQLALVDGELDIRERAFVYNVCLRNKVDLDTIGDMIDNPEPIGDLLELSLNERIEYIIDCLALVAVDGKVLPKETALVIDVASQLGFAKEVVQGFVEHIASDVNITRDNLTKLVSEHILNKNATW